jgi:hypothetical protein
MSKKTLLFLRPVGASVPGGPFVKDRTYEVGEEILNHPLIRGLLSSGDIRVLGSLGDYETGKSSEQLAAATKRIAELEAKVAELEAASQEKSAEEKGESIEEGDDKAKDEGESKVKGRGKSKDTKEESTPKE